MAELIAPWSLNDFADANTTALSHGEWALQKVRASRAGLVSGTNKLIEPEEWEAIRAAKHSMPDTFTT